MKIQNIRLGFATNSSSSHSVVIVPVEDQPSEDVIDYGHYGWEHFVLTSKAEKLAYFAAQLGETLQEDLPDNLVKIVVKELTGIDWDEGWYVDHQSILTFPRERDGKLNFKFVNNLKNFFLRDDVIVVGGNDNDYPEDQLDFGPNVFSGIREEIGPFWAIQSGNWWSLFNPETGAKIRLNYGNEKELYRSSVPELVDFHLTDACPFGCKFCYQDSIPAGKHAEYRNVTSHLYDLHKMGVFEITFGGGEPILYPQFIDVLKTTRYYGMVPNFTTKVFPNSWLHELTDAVKKYCGGFAVSVDSGSDVYALKEQCVRHGLNNKVYVHYVVGTGSYYNLEYIIEACKNTYIPLTLLGFKTVGRGENYKQDKQPIRNESLKNAGRVSVDTAFLAQYQAVLDANDVSDLLVSPQEGRFSMYLDAVNHKVGISSYHRDRLVEIKKRDLQELWDEMEPV